MASDKLSKKQIMTVTPEVYKLISRWSGLRVELQEVDDGSTREAEVSEEMDLIAGAVCNHLLLNELRVLEELPKVDD